MYTGLHSFIAPGHFANLLNLEPIGRSGNVEIRAQYGGFFQAAAASQFAALVGLLPAPLALTVSIVIFGGLFTGRILSLPLGNNKERISTNIKALYIIDGLGLIAAAWVLNGYDM